MNMTRTRQCVREDSSPYLFQETQAASTARGRYEEHQRACQMIHCVLGEIADVRFPQVAAFIQERVERTDNFAVLHQYLFIMSTAWTLEDVLRFILALEDVQHNGG